MFDKIFSSGHKVLIPYITAGVPSLEDSEKLASVLIESGAKILELGVPFSDPSADGVILQEASDLALLNKVTLQKVLKLAKRIHDNHPEVPIVLFTYLNPLLAMGLERYVEAAKDAGVAATLTVDLPLEEAHEYIRLHKKVDLKMVFLATPTTSEERLKMIAEASTAFLYYVSRNGVTGERVSLSSTLSDEISKIRSLVKCPVAIGFGISNAQQAQEVARYSDGVVIGSAYMRIILENKDPQNRDAILRELTSNCVKVME